METEISQVEVNKTCSCGVLHTTIPADAPLVGGLYWWNCSCNSTITHKVDDLAWRRTTAAARDEATKMQARRMADNRRVIIDSKVNKKPPSARGKIKLRILRRLID